MRPARPYIFAFLLATVAVRICGAEDMDVRNRANQLIDRAVLASHFASPVNIRTEVNFATTGEDGVSMSGTYVRIRSAEGVLRQDINYGDYRGSSITEQVQVAVHGHWLDTPFPVRTLYQFVPYSPIRFDATDVITSIDDSSIGGRAVSCIQFVTVRGEDHNPGDVCVSKTDNTVLEWHDRNHSWESHEYVMVNGALLPAHFTYREGSSFSLTADLKFTVLPATPEAELTVPANWQRLTSCKTFSFPIPLSAPQPAAKGGPDAPVTTVKVHLHITAQGSVTGAQVLKPVRDDLDAEAVELVKTWTYHPGNCDGRQQDFAVDTDVQFQGR